MVCFIWYTRYHEQTSQHHGWIFPPLNCSVPMSVSKPILSTYLVHFYMSSWTDVASSAFLGLDVIAALHLTQVWCKFHQLYPSVFPSLHRPVVFKPHKYPKPSYTHYFYHFIYLFFKFLKLHLPHLMVPPGLFPEPCGPSKLHPGSYLWPSRLFEAYTSGYPAPLLNVPVNLDP